MAMLKYFLLITALLAFGFAEARQYTTTHRRIIRQGSVRNGSVHKESICKGEENCINNDNCLCYCSGICDFRKKHLGDDGKQKDDPVYIKDDPYGIHCYCKPWDVEVYRRRCINGEDVPRY